MKKQSIGIILAAALGVGSLFGAAILGADTPFNTSLPGTGASTVQAHPTVMKNMTLIRTL